MDHPDFSERMADRITNFLSEQEKKSIVVYGITLMAVALTTSAAIQIAAVMLGYLLKRLLY